MSEGFLQVGIDREFLWTEKAPPERNAHFYPESVKPDLCIVLSKRGDQSLMKQRFGRSRAGSLYRDRMSSAGEARSLFRRLLYTQPTGLCISQVKKAVA
jgi:hypothetical protein